MVTLKDFCLSRDKIFFNEQICPHPHMKSLYVRLCLAPLKYAPDDFRGNSSRKIYFQLYDPNFICT